MSVPTQLDFQPYSLALRRPLTTAAGPITERRGWVVRLWDGGRVTGLGEVAPLAQAGTGSYSQVADALAELDTSELLSAVDSSAPGAWDEALAARLGELPALRSGIDLALWDRAARRARVPLAELLSPEALSPVEANALVTDLDPRGIRARLDAGFGVFKLKVGGRPLDEDRDRLGRLRELLGGRASVRLDANGAWTDPDHALDALRSLGLEGVESVEQPLAPGTEEHWPSLRPHLPCLAADESAVDEESCAALVARGAVAALVLKPARIGSLGACLRIANHAREHGVEIWVTTVLEGSIGRRSCLHLAAALGRRGTRAHGLLTGQLLSEDLAPGAPEDGPMLVIDPAASGLGVEL